MVTLPADQQHHHRGGVAEQRAMGGYRAGEMIVDHDRRDRRHETQRGREQRFRDAGRDDGEIGGVGFGNADEEFMMPQTVPNRPTNGAVAPMVASTPVPRAICRDIAASTRSSRSATRSLRPSSK